MPMPRLEQVVFLIISLSTLRGAIKTKEWHVLAEGPVALQVALPGNTVWKSHDLAPLTHIRERFPILGKPIDARRLVQEHPWWSCTQRWRTRGQQS